MRANSSLGKAVESDGDLAASRAREGTGGAGEMTIGEMAREFGVTLRTLRFYEDRHLIRPRRMGNARYYGGADRVRLEMILKGKQLGFTLAEISGSDRRRGQRSQDPTSKRGCGRRRSSIRSIISSGSGARSTRRSRSLKATRERLSSVAGAP